MKALKKSNEGFSKEGIAKVAYIFGVIQEELNETAQNFDWEGIIIECENIAIDWINKVDIQDVEEEGYIMTYAQRQLREKFIRKDFVRVVRDEGLTEDNKTDKRMYSRGFLESLEVNSLLILMKEHDYEEGYEELSKGELIDQLSNIVL